MEAHAGRESLLGWIKRDAAAAITDAGTWQELHRAVALHGLELKQRGAGLVLATRDGKTGVRASDVDRRLSLGALTKRFGVFEPAAANVTDIRAAKQYQKGTRHPHAKTAGLFTEYQRARVAAQQARQAERDALREGHTKYAAELAAYHARKREVIKRSPMPALARRNAYSALAAERAQDWTQRKELEATQRGQIGERNALPVWQDWLAQQASAGNEDALAVLRTRDQRKKKFLQDWLTADDTAAAKAVVYAHMNPHTDKTGTVRYEVADGGVVKDTGQGVRVDQRTEAATFLALLLAADKYAGQTLIVEGSDAFKDEVAKLAGSKGMAVQFADAEMEHKRQSAQAAKPARRERTQANAAVEQYVEARNNQRSKVATIGYHRAWTPADAGTANYQGRRRLVDGSEAVLLQQGDTTLVMPASSAQAAKASTWTKGQTVTTDAQGRFVSTKAMQTKTVNDRGKKR